LELRFKIKHGYNGSTYFDLDSGVGIALQNQARLQLQHFASERTLSWNCASKSSTVTTRNKLYIIPISLELRFKIKHGYNLKLFSVQNPLFIRASTLFLELKK